MIDTWCSWASSERRSAAIALARRATGWASSSEVYAYPVTAASGKTASSTPECTASSRNRSIRSRLRSTSPISGSIWQAATRTLMGRVLC